jgi:hypothetical protein
VNPPDLYMRRVKVQLNFAYNIFTPADPSSRPPKKQFQHAEKGHIMLYDKKYERGNGELLHDGLVLSDIADIKLTEHDFVPSFTTYGLNLEYELQIEITGMCADREWSGIVCAQPVHLVTASHAANMLQFEDGDAAYESEPRPMYHEVDPMRQLHHLDVTWDDRQVTAVPSIHEFDSRHMAPPIADTVPPPEYTVL